jgi:hypothetical protein
MNPIKYIEELVKKDWILYKDSSSMEYNLNNIAKGKLKGIDNIYLDFLMNFNVLSNKEKTVWFNSLKDYSNSINNDTQFSWNDFEIESLDCAEGEDEEKEILKFWSIHLPFLLSVKNGYSYLAIVIEGKSKGEIVYGREPKYKDIKTVANSLEDFMELQLSYSIDHDNDFLEDFI